MLEHGAVEALKRIGTIERYLNQAVGHPDISAVEVGNALAPLGELRESMQNLAQLCRGINIEDVDDVEQYLGTIEGVDGIGYDGLRRVLAQQRQLAGLQEMNTGALQVALADSGVSFDMPWPIMAGRCIIAKGYVLYQEMGNYLRPVEMLEFDDIAFIVAEHTLYEAQKTRTASFLGFRKRENHYTESRTHIQGICNVILINQNSVRIGIWGEQTVPKVIDLALALRSATGLEIETFLKSEKQTHWDLEGSIDHSERRLDCYA